MTAFAGAAAVKTRNSGFAAERSLAILCILYLLSTLDRHILSLVILPLQSDLRLSDTQVGVLSGLAFTALYFLTGLIIGWCVDRWSSRWTLCLGVVIWSSATIACGLARSFDQLLLARLMVGFGEAFLAPAAISLIGRLFARERLARANGFFYMSPNLGTAITFALGGMAISTLNSTNGISLPLFGHLQPWQALFVVAGIAGLPMGLLALFIHEPPRVSSVVLKTDDRQHTSLASFTRARGRLWLIHSLGFAFAAAPCIATMSWGPAYLGRAFAMPPAEVGFWIALSGGVCAPFSQILWGWVIDRLVRRGRLDAHYLVYIVVISCGIPVTILTYSGINALICCLALCLLWIIALGVGPMAAALQLFTPADLRGRVSAISHAFNAIIAIGLPPFLVGYVTDHFFGDQAMLGWSITITSIFFSLMAVITLQAGRRLLAETIDEEDRAPGSVSI